MCDTYNIGRVLNWEFRGDSAEIFCILVHVQGTHRIMESLAPSGAGPGRYGQPRGRGGGVCHVGLEGRDVTNPVVVVSERVSACPDFSLMFRACMVSCIGYLSFELILNILPVDGLRFSSF